MQFHVYKNMFSNEFVALNHEQPYFTRQCVRRLWLRTVNSIIRSLAKQLFLQLYQ